MNDEKKDLTGALRAIESNNMVLPQEEQEKRNTFIEEQAEQSSKSLIKPIRTFESDAAEAIQRGKQSVYSINKAEKAKHPKAAVDPEQKEGRKNALFLLGSALLFLVGISFALYFFLLRDTITQPINTNQAKPDSLIVSTVTTEASYNGGSDISLLTLLQQTFTSKQNTPGEIENIKITEAGEPIAIDKILSTLAGNVPGSLLRALDRTAYMLGSVQGETKKPFIIARVNYYENAFAGMLQWEPTMKALFENLTSIQSSGALEFNDAFVRNKDVRILRDESGNAILMYSFYDKKTLIITTDESAFAAIINGLREAQVAQ